MSWEAVVAIYAAVVATAALSLEVRRWVESRPRLSLSIMVDAETLGGVPDENTYVFVTVTNRGQFATTLTHFALYEYSNPLGLFRRRPSKAALVGNPIHNTGPLPYTLESGRLWMGGVIQNAELEEWMGTGRVYVGIESTHTSRSVLKRLVRRHRKA